MKELTTAMSLKEEVINANFLAVENYQFLGPRILNSGLQYSYYGGTWNTADGTEIVIADGTVTLTANATNFVYLDSTTNAVVSAVGTNSSVIPKNSFAIRKIVTNENGINYASKENFKDLRKPSFLSQNASNQGGSDGGSGGGGSDIISQKYGKITNIDGRTVTIQRTKALIGLKPDYASVNITTNANTDTTLTLTASRVGFIYASQTSPYFAAATGTTASAALQSNTNNIKALLYYFETDANNITYIEDVTNQSLQRLLDSYSTVIELSGNLSKSNTFTIPTAAQNTSSNATNYYFELFLKCKTAEHGYSSGAAAHFITNFETGSASSNNDDITVAIANSSSSNGKSFEVILDEAVKIISKTTFKKVAVTPSNWQIVVRARSPF